MKSYKIPKKNETGRVVESPLKSASARALKLRGASYDQQRAMLSPSNSGLSPADRHLMNRAPGQNDSISSEPERHQPTFTSAMYEKHQKMAADAEVNSGLTKWVREYIGSLWHDNKSRYQTVADAVDMPPELICAIHFREASGKFNTYLHQGDPLGKPAVNHPANIPVFHDWETAAIHALSMTHKVSIREDLGIQQETTDLAAMATFAEYYNGLGYHNKGRTSPYVYAQTDQYEGGKYVADGKYDPQVVDRNPGILAILSILNNPSFRVDTRPVAPKEMGYRTLRTGSRGDDVRELQSALSSMGYALEPDGSYGPATEAAVKSFQRKHGLQEDGVAGREFFKTLREKYVHESGASNSSKEGAEALKEGANTMEGWQQGGLPLQVGAKGKEVLSLQRVLKVLGAQLEVDGTYGPATQAAVSWIQRSASLRVDGIVGPATQNEILHRLQRDLTLL